MSDDLIPYGQGLPEPIPETNEESIARQYYEWERRGRGWQIHDFAVELEPPFRPFYFYLPDEGPIIDDGRIPTFFSRLVNDFPNSNLRQHSKNPSALASSTDRLHDYEAYLAEADEPELCRYPQSNNCRTSGSSASARYAS